MLWICITLLPWVSPSRCHHIHRSNMKILCAVEIQIAIFPAHLLHNNEWIVYCNFPLFCCIMYRDIMEVSQYELVMLKNPNVIPEGIPHLSYLFVATRLVWKQTYFFHKFNSHHESLSCVVAISTLANFLNELPCKLLSLI